MKHSWIWLTLEVPTLMLLSLVIQALLAFLAPLRKSSAKGLLMVALWLLYLSADSIALLVIGLISRSPQSDNDPRSDILAFWAPFLLLHLGGPDTITALALEDNELWHRHALQLATQTVVTLYVFGLSIGPGRHNCLWLPMLFMFIDGFIKYTERTCALYFASREGIRASLGEEPISSLNKWADEYYSAETSHIPSKFEVINHSPSAKEDNIIDYYNDDSESHYHKEAKIDEMVNHAYNLYDNFKGILADDVLSLKDDHNLVELLFLKQPIIIGVKIIMIELNLIYDILHTKVFLVYKRRGILRIACFLSVVTASILFFFAVGSKKYNPIDVGVTFALLAGAIVLDIAAFVRFLLSDWFIIMVTKLTVDKPSSLLNNVLSVLLKWSIWSRDPDSERWCQFTSSYNLLDCSVNPEASKVVDLVFIKRIKDYLIDWFYVEQKPINHSYLKFIFEELQRKARLAIGQEARMDQVCSARGNLVFEDDYFLVSEYLHPWTIEVHDYCRSLLTWHLATDFCYWMESSNYKEQKRELHCGISKQLSDYMVYLVLRRQELVPLVVSKSEVHFKSTKKDIIEAYSKAADPSLTKIDDRMRKFCDHVVTNKLDDRVAAEVSHYNDSQSVFDEACCLAKQLNMFGDKKWEVISKVWVEMLCYAAIRSSPRYNFANLSKGGELITLVWLFMSHLGFRLPLPEIKTLRTAKLVIGK